MLKELFYMHKSDRRVILALLTVATVAIAVIMVAGGEAEPAAGYGAGQNDTVGDTVAAADGQAHQAYYRQAAKQAERFAFDPNTADSTQLLRLGMQPWQVRNIYKYRAAGGVYRQKEDFARLYGLTVKQYRELEPYIRISPDYQPAATLVGSKQAAAEPLCADSGRDDRPSRTKKLHEAETIELATADTALLMTVPGIGPYYARRIVDYRRRLGGFASKQQLAEIDGFPTQAMPFLTLDSGQAVKRLNVNTLSLNDLKRHPYLSYYMARDIVDYRRRHGRISDMHELQLLPGFTAEAIERLLPYVEYE